MRATYSPSTRGMHHISLRQGLRPFSASRRRTVSPDRLSCPVSLTMASAKSSSVQRARPSGGFAQAVATSKASSLPVSLRSAPGRGSSLSARSRLPSTKRRLVRYTVEPPTATVRAISSSLQPASAALGALEFAGGAFAFAQHRGQFPAFGLAQFDPITYIHLDLLIGGPDESTNESKIRRRSQPQRSRLHRKARPVPGLHLHLFAHVPAPARRDRYAAPLSSQPALGPPDDRDARTKWPHSASTRCRQKHPNPGCSGRFAYPSSLSDLAVCAVDIGYPC